MVGVFGSVIIDHVFGRIFQIRDEDQMGLLFPPYSRALFQTNEFRFEANINGLGFRDREFDSRKLNQYRILAIGDSFTFGWGVDIEKAWPKVLEQNLHREGMLAEVANLGKPGAGPADYADTAEKAVPLLRPDLIVVGVLQGDDLIQSRINSKEPSESPKEKQGWNARPATGAIIRQIVLNLMYPNLRLLAHSITKKARVNRQVIVAPEWKKQAGKIVTQFNEAEKQRYEKIDKRFKQAFVSGELNPDLIDSAVKYPNAFLQIIDVEKAEVKLLVHEMARQFGRIRRVGEQYNARVIAVSVPADVYVTLTGLKRWRKLGVLVDEKMLVSESPDQAIRVACHESGLSCFSVTEHFRKRKDSHSFYEF